jgi:cellulose synthase operon protein B
LLLCATSVLAYAGLTTTASPAQAQSRGPNLVAARTSVPDGNARTRPGALVSTLTLADLGYRDGFRFANLGGRRELFVELPQGVAINPAELVLVLDDMSAHDARRSLEILVNDRSASAIALDGRAMNRIVHVPLSGTKSQDGFLKIAFQYAGAATPDRCIDVRSVGDSVTIRPESALDVDIDVGGITDVATAAVLMPRDVAVVLPGRRLTPGDFAAALTVARSLTASGHRVSFYNGYDALSELARRSDPRRWSRGIVVIGTVAEAASHLDPPVTRVAGPVPPFGTLTVARVSGVPVLLVSEVSSTQASRLIGSPWLAATRGVPAAAVGDGSAPPPPTGRITFAALGLAPATAEVFGRADILVAIDTRMLPPGTQAARLALDILVAPDGSGERAVVSVFVNERLLASAVAQVDEPTRFDLPLPDGLIGTVANVRAVIQRRSAQGDCRFEPQGYPAQILGTSAVVLAAADGHIRDFSDLVARWAGGVEVLLPEDAADHPDRAIGAVAGLLNALSPQVAPIAVTLTGTGAAPNAPFIAVGNAPPAGATARARFDRGRVVVVDRADHTVLDLGGFSAGAVAQLVTAGEQPGLWIKPLAADGSLPAPAELQLAHGDVAFFDKTGVAMVMSTERDTLVRIAYPDAVSWLTVADRYRPWVLGGVWLLATFVVLFALQSMLRRRSDTAGE